MLKDIWSESLINELSEEDINNFQEIVARDVKNKGVTTEDRTILANNLDLWLYCLRVTRRELELQLANHKTNIKIKLSELRQQNASDDEIDQAIITEQKWRNNAMKFLISIERKTLYVKLLIEEEEQNDL
jgi:hypothetical protein